MSMRDIEEEQSCQDYNAYAELQCTIESVSDR